MTIVDQIVNFIAPITPYVKLLILFIIPIYSALGAIFNNFAQIFLAWLPSDSYVVSYIIGGLFIALGIVFGIISEKKSKKE